MQAHRNMAANVTGDLTGARARLRTLEVGSEAPSGEKIEAYIDIVLAIGQGQEFIDLLVRYIGELEAQLLDAQRERDEYQAERRTLAGRVDELEGKLNVATRELEKSRQQYVTTSADREQVLKKLAEVTHKLDQMREKYEPF